MQKPHLSKEQALQKVRQFCAYQERSHSEVRQKLKDLGVTGHEGEEIISSLIEDNYLNEERFAIQYAGGKFRLKEWGRRKIYYALKEKRVSDQCIGRALAAIDEDDYLETLGRLAEKKYELLKNEPGPLRKKKTTDYLLQKGFEPELINEILSSRFKK